MEKHEIVEKIVVRLIIGIILVVAWFLTKESNELLFKYRDEFPLRYLENRLFRFGLLCASFALFILAFVYFIRLVVKKK